jgi:hypothetical protein
MKVGVREPETVTALWATAARARVRSRAERGLAEPKRQTLLPDTARAVEEHAGWQSTALERFGQPIAKAVVAVQLDNRSLHVA